jgi:hypothetical protein
VASVGTDKDIVKSSCEKGIECLLAGDIETGKATLRDYINATIGFEDT